MGQRDPKAEYLAHAAEARREAARSFNLKTRQGFLDIARQWEVLAEVAEKRKEKGFDAGEGGTGRDPTPQQ